MVTITQKDLAIIAGLGGAADNSNCALPAPAVLAAIVADVSR